MNERFDIVIAGAGMVGLTVAALLAKSSCARRLRIVVLDAGNAPQFEAEGAEVDMRVSAISPGSAEILNETGVWDEIRRQRACPFRAMRVWDADGSADGPETLRFDAADLAVTELGHIVENSLIQRSLLRELARSGQAVQFGVALEKLHAAGERFLVHGAQSGPLRPELLIAADGGNSFIRTAAGIRVRSWRYAQTAFVTHATPERPHGNVAWQRFLRSGPLALLPLNDGRVSIVWSTTEEQAKRALAASDATLRQMLGEASDFVLGQLDPCGPRGTFPLRAQYALQYALPGLVLLGDAAHSVHPLAGQGVNLGLADAAVLVTEIEHAFERGEHPGDLPTLRRFERARKGANQMMLRFIDGISRLFASDSAPASRLRGTGMLLFNRSGPLRRQAARVALGLRR